MLLEHEGSGSGAGVDYLTRKPSASEKRNEGALIQNGSA
jgi:hypothetical protein